MWHLVLCLATLLFHASGEPSIIDIPALGGDASHLQISGTNENLSPSTAVDPPTKIKETIPSEHRY